ncbi:hypothetical protein [Emticicia sp. TH156]|uniref:hypothetical protein n=1 Tax=Emticicia sp. TH156 TaxID=2067454 RepID=UPI000C77F718|nr:hypothetical protein [Emticicia sp. TH156]PLK43726.1 hypothetical protein C0V77_14525 [Emticicia sp. TH156]
MAKGIVKFCYKKVIDKGSQGSWDKLVFDDTWLEFSMQSQFFNKDGKYETYKDIVKNIPGAEKLNYLVSTAAINYIRQLNNLVPDVFNSLHELCLPFENFRFEILQSHVSHKQDHQVVIYFYSEPVLWIDTIYNQLLIATGQPLENALEKDDIKTDLISLMPDLSISSFKSI